MVGRNAAQQSRLNGAVAVTIAAIYPNGTAEVVGEKQMMFSQGDEWVQFAGRIRLIDIDSDNRLASSQVANARIIYSGKGAVQQAQPTGLAQPLLQRHFALLTESTDDAHSVPPAVCPAGAAGDLRPGPCRGRTDPRNLGQFEGLRANQVTGYGVVVGLQGTGDNNLQYVTEAMRGISGRLGLQLPPGVSPILRNAAAVIVTAELARLCQARPADRHYRVHFGPGLVAARRGVDPYSAIRRGRADLRDGAGAMLRSEAWGVSGRDGSQLTVNVTTVGRIADGATVERAVATGFDAAPTLRFNLHPGRFPHRRARARCDQQPLSRHCHHRRRGQHRTRPAARQ